MQGQNPTTIIVDDAMEEILHQMAPALNKRDRERLERKLMASTTRTIAAHPTTQRIIDKVVRDSKPPTLKSLFPGLGTRRKG